MKFIVLLCFIGLIVAVSADCEVDGKTYKTGESWTPKNTCNLQTCTGDNTLTAKACAEEAVADPSKYNYIPEDTSKPYPECCPHYEKKN